MQKINYLNLIKSNWQAIAITTAVLVLLTIIISLIQPFEYRARTGFLIVQNQTQGLDAYAAAKASERLATNLANIIKTDSFYQKVLSTGLNNIELPEKESARRKAWEKMVNTQIAQESSIMTVDVFYKDKLKAEKVSKAIALVLVNDSAEYHGGGSSVIIKMVNTPLVSNYPVRPNIIFNVFSALMIGLIFSSGYVIYIEYSKISDLLDLDVIETKTKIKTEKNFDTEMGIQEFPIKTMLSEPFGKKYYFEN